MNNNMPTSIPSVQPWKLSAKGNVYCTWENVPNI